MSLFEQIKKWTNSGTPLNEVEALLEKIASLKLGERLSKFDLYTKAKTVFDRSLEEELETKLKDRSKGIPLQYITGEQQFLDHHYKVNRYVLIPRPETEVLVEETKKILIKKIGYGQKFLGFELGLGSGVISIELLSVFNQLEMEATDTSIGALEVAKENANHILNLKSQNLKSRLVSENEIIPSQLFEPARYDFIISNPPYLLDDPSEIQGQVKKHEPKDALFAPLGDPFYYYRKLAEQGRTVLKHGGYLFFEIPHERADRIARDVKSLGYDVQLIMDLNSRPRVLIAELKEKIQ